MAIRLDQVKHWLASNIIGWRMYYSGVYYDEPYMICRCRKQPNVLASWWSLHQFGFGTYEWKAKLLASGANGVHWLGLFELHHGFLEEGIIGVENREGTYCFTTSWAGLVTRVALAGQDWTKERTFRVVWDKTKAELWVDGVKVATITTNVPQKPMGVFNETEALATAPAFEPTVYFNLESFRKVS